MLFPLNLILTFLCRNLALQKLMQMMPKYFVPWKIYTFTQGKPIIEGITEGRVGKIKYDYKIIRIMVVIFIQI
jgi:hypothetical protein